ncbi:hypothetical protein [uncultured Sunxiuqinia sp.]|uniref:hypothetical protein n=1 Tax=uncultured Sunxiuqinia sp. TaxID=1573825 RepID=UPI002AA8D931|nr:hypothetical protein [uncultured Sunxiuqinia sp.]
MKYNWIRNKACKIDGIEHTISHRMIRDKMGKEEFTTLIVKNHPTDPEEICSFNSNSSEEMYQQTETKLNEVSTDNYEIGDFID